MGPEDGGPSGFQKTSRVVGEGLSKDRGLESIVPEEPIEGMGDGT